RALHRAVATVIGAAAGNPTTRTDHTLIEAHERTDGLIGRTRGISSADGPVQQWTGDIEDEPAIILVLLRSCQFIWVKGRTRGHPEYTTGLGFQRNDGAALIAQ